ncbi:phage tail assembly chaperone [Pseudomonas sp. NPDC096950]|uniref:phage tail assembly chaperone n=1 Tax=Pseudomonas sp. NPDC096950 TaxID=3364485 RepID=UPI00383BB9FA
MSEQKVFFALSTGGFYLADDQAFYEQEGGWPLDARELTDQEKAQYWKQSAPFNKVLGLEDGNLAWVDLPEPSTEELAARARQWRDTEIESVKWLRERHRDEVDSARPTTLTTAQSGELLDYVQALRDWPTDSGFPEIASRPAKPDWIAQQIS